jgi:hypothetical protein
MITRAASMKGRRVKKQFPISIGILTKSCVSPQVGS